TTRRVVGIQHGKAIFNLSASFHVAEEGVEHQLPAPSAPPAESLPTFQERLAPWKEKLGDWYWRPRPIDLRFVGEPARNTDLGKREPRQQVWIKADGTLPDDPLLHACVVAYASDMTLLDSVLIAHELSWDQPELQGASLDHAMWFHRPFRADQWLLYNQESPSAHGARALAAGRIYTEDGTHVVTVMQEGLIRIVER
ncbi:MAG TPA: acyl-CoA thioesterase II, partial [Acidimicrobiales bacterium]|nr:acyl-CoA thioesterase II [Acidimicrobiales bacterium]